MIDLLLNLIGLIQELMLTLTLDFTKQKEVLRNIIASIAVIQQRSGLGFTILMKRI